MAKFDEEKREEKIAALKKREAEDLAEILSKKYGIPYINLSKVTVDIDALKILPEKEAREGKIVVFQGVGKKLRVGVESPDSIKTKVVLEDLKRKLYKIKLFMVSRIGLERVWDRYKEVQEFEAVASGLINISEKNLSKYIKEIKNIDKFREVIKPVIATRELRKISEVLEVMLAGAYSLEVSDVHVEPQEDRTLLRFRLDGVLHNIVYFPLNVYKLLLSRIKLISEIKLNITNRPQDGRFTIRIQDIDVEVRVSVMPGAYGESLVLRILHPKSIGVSLEDLGMQEDLLNLMQNEIKKPYGMILTTGPTGSGKTTTLYSFIQKINSPDIKIITIENPVEYHLEGINQSQVDPSKGYEFGDALRSILRQDPDVILVGEIRDLDTARTAINAALTGHLVLSTLHTNNAYGTVPRLIDLGVKPNIIAPAISVSMAQRLIRVLCKKCKKETKASAEDIKYIEKMLSDFPENIKAPDLKNISLWTAGGCGECNDTGFKGRIGIYEAFQIDERAEKVILQNPLETEFRKIAKDQGRMTMEQDGVLKVLSGVTSLKELERVVGK